MIKGKKGITLVSLIIVIALMLIISSTVVYISLDRFQINNLRKMTNDIELLQDKVSNYYLKHGVLPVVKESDGKAIEYYYTSLDFTKNADDNDVYYILDLDAMEGISLNYGREGFENPNASEDVYIINELTHTIYYALGIEYEEEVYHYVGGSSSLLDNIPPTSPQINVISGTKNNEGIYTTAVEIEIVPGKDNWSGIAGTQYSLDGGTTWIELDDSSNIYRISKNGTHNIKAKSYDASIDSNYSIETTLTLEIEKIMLGWTDNGDGTFSNGETTVAIGDYVQYTYDAVTYILPDECLPNQNSSNLMGAHRNLKWRVLGINSEGELELVSEIPAWSFAVFDGAWGYNNGVYILNDICNVQFSNKELGTTARNLNIEDIEKQYTSAGFLMKNAFFTGYEYDSIRYGETRECREKGDEVAYWYPLLYEEETLSGINGSIKEDGISLSDPFYSKDSLTLKDESSDWISGVLLATQTFYDLYSVYEEKDPNYKNSTFYDMIFNTETITGENDHHSFWLSSRCVNIANVFGGSYSVDVTRAEFGLFYVTETNRDYGFGIQKGNLERAQMFRSDGLDSMTGYDFYLRPVVTLGNDISVITNNAPNSTSNMWTLEKE